MDNRRATKIEPYSKRGRSTRHHHRLTTHPSQEEEPNLENRAKHHRISDSLQLQLQTQLPALSGDDNYVRQWLVRTENVGDIISENAKPDRAKTEHRSSKQKRLPGFKSLHHAVEDVEAPQIHFGKKRRRNSSSDSSLLKLAVQEPPALVMRKKRTASIRSLTESHHHHSNKHRAKSPDSGVSSYGNARLEIFEKRLRHKTREDRYKLKNKKEKPIDKDGEDRPRTKRVKRGDAAKAAKTAGKKLMNSFASKSISKDRLTIRPSLGLGIFKNGRASSPAKRRGVPDLAFSEMDFLQRSTYALPAKKEETFTSKSREKDKRKIERTHNEISTFFRRAKSHLNETSPNNRKADDMDITTSEKAVTYISWSETQLSPRITSASRRRSDHSRHISVTPESIRNSIVKTRIFEGTGISRSPERGRFRGSEPKLYTRSSPTSRSDESFSSSPHGRHAKHLSSKDQKHAQKVVLPNCSSHKRKDGRKQVEQSSTRAAPTSSPSGSANQLVIEHYDQETGWNLGEVSGNILSRVSVQESPARKMKSSPLNRGKLAHKAYIKRPATTLRKGGFPNEFNKKVIEQSPENLEESINRFGSEDSSKCVDSKTSARQQGILEATAEVAPEKIDPNSTSVKNSHANTAQSKSASASLVDKVPIVAARMKRLSDGSTTRTNSDAAIGEPETMSLTNKYESYISEAPLPESWIRHGPGQVNHLAHLSPINDVVSLYFQQLQRSHTLDGQPAQSDNPYVEEDANQHLEDYIIGPGWSLAEVEDLGDEGLAEGIGDYLDHTEPDFYVGGDAWTGEEQQAGGSGREDITVYNLPQYSEQQTLNGYGVPAGSDIANFGMPFVADRVSQELSIQGDISTRRFWRPNRQY